MCVMYTLAFLHYQYKEVEAARTQYHTQCELRQALEEQVDMVRISMQTVLAVMCETCISLSSLSCAPCPHHHLTLIAQ